MQIPVRLGPAELTLIEQLQAAGATPDVERLSTVGLPTRRVESYHFTDLKLLLRDVPPMAAEAAAPTGPTLTIPGAYALSIVNGRLQDHAAPAEGVFVHRNDVALVTKFDDVLTRLNVALAPECATLFVGNEAERIIHIDRRTEGDASHSVSAASVAVTDGGKATIIETIGGSDAAHVSNHSTIVHVGRDADVTHITVDLSGKAARTFGVIEYQVAGNGRLRSLVVHAGSALRRANIRAFMGESGSDATLTGLNLVDDGQHHDITLQVDHKAVGTASHPLFKQIARGRATAVFQGKLVVARDAQKTDAKMSMNGLMLTEDAQILSKPELEIYADDVVCGHGSTCGALDQTSLFYLMSRGIPRAQAETMLVRAFLAELIDPIAHEGAHEALTGVIEGWLAGSP